MNNSTVIESLRNRLKNVRKEEEDMGTERSLTKPFQKVKIAEMLNKKDGLRKIQVRQQLKPLEKHLEKPVDERQTLAKKRMVVKTKRLPKVKLQS